MASFKSSFKQDTIDVIFNDELLKYVTSYLVNVQKEEIHKHSILSCVIPLRPGIRFTNYFHFLFSHSQWFGTHRWSSAHLHKTC